MKGWWIEEIPVGYVSHKDTLIKPVYTWYPVQIKASLE